MRRLDEPREVIQRGRPGVLAVADLSLQDEHVPDSNVLEAFAIEAPSRFKHDPSEYVALAEEGLNNTEIAKHFGDVSEATVRRGVASVGYKRSETRTGESER